MRMNLFSDLGYLRQLPEDSKEAIAAERAGHRVKLATKTGREAARPQWGRGTKAPETAPGFRCRLAGKT